MGRHGWNCNGIYSFRCILESQFFYSTSVRGPVSTPTSRNSLSSLENFLVTSLGFSEKQALSTSTKLTKLGQSQRPTKVIKFNFLRNADLLVNFLQQKGFTKPHIRNVVYSLPLLLASRIERTLEPKMKTFQELGLSGPDLADVISNQPAILGYSLNSTIQPALEALRLVMGSNENLVKAIKRLKWYHFSLVSKYLRSNVSLLRARDIPMQSIQRSMLTQPSTLLQKPEFFKDIVARAEKKWGVSPQSPRFLDAVRVLVSLHEKTIESKCRVFESFGWDRSDVIDLFRRNPGCLSISEGTIKVKLSFFMNELGYDPGYILTHSPLMGYGFEKRVLPRHVILKTLKQKGLMKENCPLYTALTYDESKFLRKFVLPFQDVVPNLHDIYANSKGPVLWSKMKTEVKPHLQKSN